MEIKIINSDDYSVTLTMDIETFEGKMFTCPDCGQTHFLCDGVIIEGEYVCFNCVCTCSICGKYIRNDDSYRTTDSDYDYCHDCFISETYRCLDCGERFRYEDDLHEVDDGWYCGDCYPNHKPIIASYHSMKDYGDIVFYGNADRRDVLHIGFELETDSDHRVDRQKIAEGVKEILCDFVNMENDGSLNYGFEIISHPATLEHHLSLMPKYKKTFEYLMDNDMKGHDISTTGMHHHIDRRYFGSKEDSSIAKLMYLFEKYHREFKIFARRTDAQCADWCRSRKQSYNGKAGWIKKAVMESKAYSSYQQRYYNINLTNANTIEIRLWKSTHNPETFEATLKFTAHLAEICKTTRAVDLAKKTFEDLLGTDKVILSYWNRINNK